MGTKPTRGRTFRRVEPGSEVARSARIWNGRFPPRCPAGRRRGACTGHVFPRGGLGWAGRALGMACENVGALDIVAADAELVHASPTENADLYWAARGSGPGFFGVVTRYHLRLHKKP